MMFPKLHIGVYLGRNYNSHHVLGDVHNVAVESLTYFCELHLSCLHFDCTVTKATHQIKFVIIPYWFSCLLN